MDETTVNKKGAIEERTLYGRIKSIARWATLFGAPLMCLTGFLFIYFYNPYDPNRIRFPCLFLLFTGFYCPGCGNTRALHALVHLDITGVFKNNVLFPFLFFLLGWLLVGEYFRLATGRRILLLPKSIRLWWILSGSAIVIVFTILRNIPFYPFSWLAPG